MMRVFARFTALLLTAAALSAMAVAQSASARTGKPYAAGAASKLRLGVYDCMSYDFASGLLSYMESVELTGGGRYQQAWGRHGRKMIKPTNGTYKVKGSRLIFHGGALSKTPGQIHTQGHGYPFFALLLHGKPSGFSCYYVPKA